MFARIENHLVVELLDVEVLPPFHPDLVWVEVPEGQSVNERDSYIDGVFIPAEDMIDIETWRKDKIAEVSAIYSQKIEEGFSFEGNLYHLDATSRSNIGLMKLDIQAGAVNPHGGFWIGKTGKHQLSDAKVIELANAALSAYQALLFKKQEHLEKIYSEDDKETLKNYDTSSGWA